MRRPPNDKRTALASVVVCVCFLALYSARPRLQMDSSQGTFDIRFFPDPPLVDGDEPVRIAIYTLMTNAPDDAYASLVRTNRDAFVAAHPARFASILRTEALPGIEFLPWQKLYDFLLDPLPEFDWIWFLDADALITNKTTSLAGFLSALPPDVGAVFGDVPRARPMVINSGSFFLRNDRRSRKWAMHAVAMQKDATVYNIKAWWENAALVHMYERNTLGLRDSTALIPAQHINSLIMDRGGWHRLDHQHRWEVGDAVAHAASLGYEAMRAWARAHPAFV